MSDSQTPPPAPRASQTTNVILAIIAAVLLFFVYQYVASENRAAIATLKYDRCWSEDCKSAIRQRWIRGE